MASVDIWFRIFKERVRVSSDIYSEMDVGFHSLISLNAFSGAFNYMINA